MKRIEDHENVVSQSLCAVTRVRVAGSPVSPARYGVNVAETRQLHGKVVENVGGVPRAGQQDERTARSSPIEHFELNAIVNMHKVDPVRRWVFPLRRLRA